MTTTLTPEAVERLRSVLRQHHMWDHIETVRALLAHVDALTKERDAKLPSGLTREEHRRKVIDENERLLLSNIELRRERDAALATDQKGGE